MGGDREQKALHTQRVHTQRCVHFFSVLHLSEDLSETLREAYIQPLEAFTVKI